MASLTTALGIATSGMNYSQIGLATVSHNIANVNTEGFSRQNVIAGAASNNGYGAGVQLSTIQRIQDSFVNDRLLKQSSDLSYASTKRSYLDTIEGAFSGASAEGSLDALMGNVYDSFGVLANNPGDSALKRNAVQQLVLFTDTIRDVNADLDAQQTVIDNQITADLTSLNQLLEDVYALNTEITKQTLGTANGSNANDLQDQRDIKIAQLSEVFKLNVSNNTTSGGYRITTENGRRLVDEGGYVQFERIAGSGSFQDIGFRNVLPDGSLSTSSIRLDTDNLTSGRIKALVDLRDTNIANIVSQLDEFASTLIAETNKVASRGSAFPPQRTLASANGSATLTATTDNLYTTLDANLADDTFHLSIVDASGTVVHTTVGSVGGAITLPNLATGLTMDGLVTLINGNAAVGVTGLGAGLGVTASAATDANGDPYVQLQATNSNYRVVINNVTGDFAGILGFNNIFSGTDSDDIAVRDALETTPELFPTARMRSSDGGLSSLNNENILALAQMADSNFSFSSAGGLGAQNDTPRGYLGQMTSQLAVTLQDAKSREAYTDSLHNQLTELKSSIAGVNINEELSQMLIYQNSFQASARIMSVINEMLAEIVNITR